MVEVDLPLLVGDQIVMFVNNAKVLADWLAEGESGSGYQDFSATLT